MSASPGDTKSSHAVGGAEAAPPGLPADEMHGRVVRGVAWKAASTISAQLTRFVVAAILAHLLSPRDYGLAGMVLVFASLVYLFSDLSLGAALIQRPNPSEADRSTVFWTSLGTGMLLTLAGIAVSPLIADFYGEPSVGPLFAAMSLSFVVSSIASTQAALLVRDMNFRSLELRTMAGTLASGSIGITLAAMGYGAWAIIAQQLAAVAVSTVLLVILSPWRPHLTFSVSSLRDLGGYSGNDFGARLLFYFNRNADNLLIGRFLGPAALGAYAVAYNLMLLPIGQIAIPIQEVLFPALSRMQGDRVRATSAWLRANRLVGAITIPAMLGLIILASDFVHVVLGEKWDSAVPVIRILAWVGLLQSLQGLNSSVLRAMDRTRILFRYSIVVVTASVIAFVAGLPWGIVGVAAAYAMSSTIVEPFYTWLTTRALGTTLRRFGRSLTGVVQAALIMAVAVGLGLLLTERLGLPPIVRLPLLIAVGAAVYLPCCAWRAPEVLIEARGLRRRRREASAPPPPSEPLSSPSA